MATDNIFAGTITCTGMTVNGTITVTGAIASTVGFVGPSLTAISAGVIEGAAGKLVLVSATSGVANTAGAGGVGGAGSLFAGNGANGSTTGGAGGALLFFAGNGGNGTAGNGGAGGSFTVSAGAGGATNANGGDINLIPGAGTGTGRNGEVRINSSNAGFIPVAFNYYAGAIDTSFFIASRAYRVKSVILRVDVTAGAGITALIKKAASGTAINAGTSISTTAFALDGAAFTNQNGVLAAAADLEIAAGDAIGIDFTGAVAVGAAGSVTVTLVPV
jgi:hypothetical protein